MKIIEFIREQLHDRLHLSGTAFFSSASTLRKGKYLIVGINPGGSKEGTDSIDLSLDNFQKTEWKNAFFDPSWGRSQYQNGVKGLFVHLGVELSEICATNFIYERSRNEKGLDKECYDRYRRILNKVIETVQPDNIIAIGEIPYVEVKRLAGSINGENIVRDSGHGNWQLILTMVEFGGKPTKVFYLPHLSRYALCGRTEQLDWLKRQMNSV